MINLLDNYYFSKKFGALRAHGWLDGDPDSKLCGSFFFLCAPWMTESRR